MTPLILPLHHTNTHVHKHIHTSTPTSCANPPIKLTLSIPLPKHAVLCQQALVSSKQRNQKCEGFLRHGWGLLIPSYWLFLSLFLLPSYVLKARKERIAISFLVHKLAFPSPLSSLLPSLSFFHGFVRAPTWAWWGSPMLAGVPERLKKRWGDRKRGRWCWGLDGKKREGGVRNWDKRKGACE